MPTDRTAIPDPDRHPAVVQARGRLAALTTERTETRDLIRDLEAELGTAPGEPDEALEARLLAAGKPTDDVTALRELRRRERVFKQAVEITTADLSRAKEQAVRDLTPGVRRDVFEPAARQAVAAWLAAAVAIEAFRVLVEDVRGAGLGNGLFSPFNDRVPVSRADHDSLAAFARGLIGDGFATPDEINAAFPGLV